MAFVMWRMSVSNSSTGWRARVLTVVEGVGVHVARVDALDLLLEQVAQQLRLGVDVLLERLAGDQMFHHRNHVLRCVRGELEKPDGHARAVEGIRDHEVAHALGGHDWHHETLPIGVFGFGVDVIIRDAERFGVDALEFVGDDELA